jgi:AmmeMemoRadiSam system protein A
MQTELIDWSLSGEARGFLLRLARATIEARLDGAPLPSSEPEDENLLEPRGAFVTLKIDGRLRGCIGHVVGVAPLWLAVRENAIAAAFEDPRFAPLEADELLVARIEISALTPLHKVAADEIEVGRDGILLERGHARGLLLPQVAVEYGWDQETFLDHTCRKAGLAPGCWRDPDTTISTFSAEVFGEEDS